MADSVSTPEFLSLAHRLPMLDVRSPSEFRQGHIPGAISFPLFHDEERAEIGTIYKHNGRNSAVLRGLDFVGPRMRSMVESAQAMVRENRRNGDAGDGSVLPDLLIHCWRGGMRSQSLAWLLEQAGISVLLLEGGYKSFRRFAHAIFAEPLPIVVLSGLTGAGKSRQLPLLMEAGEQVIDLEGLANHRGSAFGALGLPPQPTVEQFENDLLAELLKLDRTRTIWVEDESRNIGQVVVPAPFYNQYRAAPAIFMDVPRSVRARLLAEEYGPQNIDGIRDSIEAIRKRLGGQNVNRAFELLDRGLLVECADCLLEYYDNAYMISKSRMTRKIMIDVPAEDPGCREFTKQLLLVAKDVLAETVS